MENVPLPDAMNTMGKHEVWRPELEMDEKHVAMLNATQVCVCVCVCLTLVEATRAPKRACGPALHTSWDKRCHW
jgi:hypothetical protein